MNIKQTAGGLLLMSAILASCSDNLDLITPQYFPFQEKEEGRWGMISADGNVLFSEEFKQTPTVAIGERFAVPSKSGNFTVYDTEEKPNVVIEGLKEMSFFYGDVAVAVKPGSHIFLLNSDGTTRKDLKELAGKSVKTVNSFNEDAAVFSTTDGFYGLMDTDGNVLVQPEYVQMSSQLTNGRILAVHKQYKAFVDNNDVKKVIYSLLDASGKELCKIKGDKYERVNMDLTGSGYVNVVVSKDDEQMGALLNDKAEYAFEPRSKFPVVIFEYDGKVYFEDEDQERGVADLDGEIILRPKYEYCSPSMDDLFMVKLNEEEEYFLVNDEGERQKGTSYEQIILFSLKEKYAYGRKEEGNWRLFDSDGEKVKLDVDVYNMSSTLYNFTIHSDYFDASAFVQQLDMNAEGGFGLTLDMSLEQLKEWIDKADEERYVSPFLDLDSAVADSETEVCEEPDESFYDEFQPDFATDENPAEVTGVRNDELGKYLMEHFLSGGSVFNMDRNAYEVSVLYNQPVFSYYSYLNDNFDLEENYMVYPLNPQTVEIKIPLNTTAMQKSADILKALKSKVHAKNVQKTSDTHLCLQLENGNIFTAEIYDNMLHLRWHNAKAQVVAPAQ